MKGNNSLDFTLRHWWLRGRRAGHVTRQPPRAFARSRRGVRARLERGGAGAGGPSRVRRVPRRAARASVAHLGRISATTGGSCRSVDAARRAGFGYRVGSRAHPRARSLLKARRRRRRRRLERRRARARPRVGDPRGKKVCQRGTYPTRIPPAVRARWRSKPPTRPPRTPRSRAARRRWRRYARADSRTKTPTSPRPEPREKRRARLEGENLVSVVSGRRASRACGTDPGRETRVRGFVSFATDARERFAPTDLSVTPPHLERVTSRAT